MAAAAAVAAATAAAKMTRPPSTRHLVPSNQLSSISLSLSLFILDTLIVLRERVSIYLSIESTGVYLYGKGEPYLLHRCIETEAGSLNPANI